MTSMLGTLNKLDSELRISLLSDSKFTEFSRKFKIRAYVGISLKEHSSESTFFFPNSAEFNRDTAMFLHRYDAFERNGVFRIKRGFPESDESARLIRDMLGVPSLILTDLWLSDGWYRAGFVFHHSHTEEVSNILMQLSYLPSKFSIDYLGHTEGFSRILSRIDERMGLYVAEVECITPDEELKKQKNPVGDLWARILKNPYGSGDATGIYFTDRSPADSKDTLTVEENSIYQAPAENSYSSHMNNAANMERVATLARIHEFNSPVFKATVILPAILSKEWLTVWNSSNEKFSSWKPVLTNFTDYKSWEKKEIQNSDHKLSVYVH